MTFKWKVNIISVYFFDVVREMSQTLLVCKCVTRENFDYEQYTGKDDILALVESGSFRVNDGSGEQHAGPCEAVCFKQGKIYERRVVEPVKLHLFRYHTGSGIFPSGKITFRDVQRVRSTLELLNVSNRQEFYGDFACKQALFNDLINQYRLENPKGIQSLAKSDPVISQAVMQINDNLHKKLRLTELAEEYYLSYVQFSRRFKAAVGTTVQDYITQMRIRKAQSLLADGDLPVREIATTCGFANEYYFSNFFRKHQGVSPSEYRSIVRSTEEL